MTTERHSCPRCRRTVAVLTPVEVTGAATYLERIGLATLGAALRAVKVFRRHRDSMGAICLGGRERLETIEPPA